MQIVLIKTVNLNTELSLVIGPNYLFRDCSIDEICNFCVFEQAYNCPSKASTIKKFKSYIK